MTWSVIVPIKELPRAKSRLRPTLYDSGVWALAFATDTLDAIAGSEMVTQLVVVTDDASISRIALANGAVVVPEPVPGGLNVAAAAGIGLARGLSRRPVAVLTADLPGLTSAELDRTLQRALLHPLAMVADAEGTGTTAVMARDPAGLHPQFGVDSRERHESAGHVVLDVPESSGIRRDVDTVHQLDALDFVGPNTSALLRSAGRARQ